MHSQVKTSASPLSSTGLALILSAILLFLAAVNARYLPTRADETDVEVLKDLIRGLVAQSKMEQLEARLASKLQQPNAQSRFLQATEYGHQMNNIQQPLLMERRSVELPLSSNGDSHLRLMSGIKSGR